MADLSVLAAKGAATQPNTPSSLGTNKEKSILSQLAAGEKTESMIDFEENLNKNNGGFFGGIGYFFEKLGLGILSSIEGIWDYTAGGLAKLFGADDWAEQQFANDWVNYNHADEWYNPSDGWKVAGDVAGGIGTSIPAIATVAAAGAIAVASGGTLTPVAAALISGTVAGLGAAGNATKEAYRQTGELGGKEFGYGALVGITEGAVEGISAGIGAGTGQVVKNISKSFGKEIAETATRETLGKAVVKGFIGEAFEEGLSEILDPVWARLTYDPNAKNATFQEVGYAALIGGLSGAIMGGVDVSVRNVASTARGNKIVSEGKANNVIQMAEQLNSYESTNKTGLESFELVQNVYTELQNSMQKTNGQITTMKQKMLLGVLERANTTAVFSPIVARSAENIVNNADLIAQKLNSYGYTDANGKAITFTTEQIKNGVDINDSKTFSKALKTNDVLRSLAVADATGQITMNTAKFQEATLMGQKLSSQVDLNRFIETATDSELQAVGEKLGINNWQSLTNAEFQEKITEFVRNDGVESYKKERLIVKDAENLSVESAKELPKRLNMTEDGAVRYTQGDSQIAIIKDGDNYRMYDYQSKRLSKVLTKQEVNKVLRQLNTQAQTVATEVRQQLEQESTLRQQAAEIDSYARENIADYQKLNSANQSMVRAVIRQGRAAGIAEADVLSYARVSAHTGLNITYSKDLCVVGKNTETGENVYSDGYYDPNNNRIVVNPETKRTHEALLLHELDHAIRKTPDGGTIIEQGVKNMSKEEKEAIINRYRNAGRGGSVELIEEINAHYAEGILTNKNLLEKLCESKPTLKEKILNFFKKSKSTYSEDVKLSKEAQSLYKRYKKLFDEFSARNQGNNAAEISAVNTTSEAYALAKDSENDYNNQKGVENGQETTETTKTTEAKENGRSNESLRGSRGRGISVFNDYGTVRQLSEIVKNTETVQKIGDFFTEIYTEPQTDTQENLVWHAKNEDINIYFAKTKENAANVYFYDGKSLILRENASEQALVDILDREKPVKRNIDANKVAHISAERWSKFIEFEPNAYLTRIPIQQFLDMTTESYVEQRQLNARSTQISKKVAASDIKNTAGEYMYLEIDLKNKKVTNHEGRHRMTALLNAGNAYADVFVIPVNDAGIDSYGNIEVQGQFNTDKHNLGLVRAKSSKFAAAIEQVFKADDGNIRFALPENDSNGSSLTKEQQDFFKDSAIRADMIDGWKEISPNGALLPVYHGTNSSEFFEFDKSTIGTANDMGWYGKGFYFAFSESEAATYGRNVMECYLNIKKPFIFDEQMQSFDGINDGDVQFDFASFVINIADKFPAIAKKLTVDVVNEFNSYGEGTSTEINFAELSKQIKEIYNNKRLQVTTIQDGSNTFWAYKFKSNIENLEIEPEIRNIMDENYIRHAFAAEMALRNNKITKAQYDKILELFDKYGEQEFETKFLNARFYSEADAIESRLSAAVSYLSEYKYSYLEQHIPEHFMQQIGNEFNSELRKQGYDGVIQSRKGDEIVAFESNQIKLTSNKKPTDSNDIRYALPTEDNSGKQLSQQQSNYFKDSKIKDKQGRLIVAYHGTNSQFYTFRNKGAVNGRSQGDGFYFTANNEFATEYGSRVITAYLNIKNPFYLHEKRTIQSELEHRGYDIKELAGKYGIELNEFDGISWGKDEKTLLTKMGYDGVISVWGEEDTISTNAEDRTIIVAYKSNQIKEVTNSTPTKESDIRFALQEDENSTIGGLTKGQRAKFVANNTKFKVYSKLDATEVINSIISERLVFDDKYGTLSGKSKAEVIDRLFTKLNSANEGYRTGVALNIADYILENAVLEDMYDLTDNSDAMRELSVLRSYMHNVDLSGIQEEIKYKYDNKNNINLIWGNKNSKQTPDIIAQELAEFGIFIDAVNEADIFFQMVDKYESARAAVNKKVETIKLKTYGSKAKIEELRQQIARDILLAYDEKGEKSKYAKLVEKYTDKIANLTKQVKEADKKNKLVNSVIDSAQYLKSVADKRSYVGAEVFNAPELTSWLKELGKLKYRSDLRKAGARTLLLNYGKFYNTSNPLLYDSDPNLNYIDENVIDAINFIKANENSTAPLSYEELQAAQVIMASAKHLFQNYDQMILEGKKVRISEAAANGIAILQQSKNRVGKGFFNNIYGMFNKIVEPRAVIKSLENYNPDGILTRAYKQITDGETASGLMYIDLVSEFDNFFKSNKKYKKRLTSEYVKVGDAELTIGQAISLYELSKREQAQAGLYESGFSYLDKKGAKQSVRITERNIQELAKNFTESDKQFVAIVEDFFNVKSKNAKTAADLEILGYTNASEDFYFPIKRDSGTIAKNITDARSIMSDWANVYNFSFNKDVKAGSKNKLFITDVYSVVSRHAKQLSTYANLTVPLKNFSQLYAKNIGSKTDVRTIKNTVNEQVWDRADRYLSKLFADIQGRATSSSFIEKLRGAYAKYQLGANLKVIVSQVTSYPTAGVILDIDSMAKGAVMKTNYKALDEYCAYAKVRNYEKGVVRAEGVIDKVGKVGDVLTKPIQWTDRLTIGKLWNACQVQVQKDNGHKIGTVENMKAAGVLLEEVVRLTQPNYTNTERSELMRSDSDIVRSFTMFTSVPLKQLSRLVESVGEFRALRQMIKSGNASTEVAARYKIAKRKLSRTLASITVANLMYVLVGQFFKWLYNKDREDKEGNKISFIQDLTNDFVSTNIGMFPVVKDIYNFFVNDYEFSNFAYETVESVLSASKELFELATKAANGEIVDKSEYMRPLRNSLYAIGQITGIPVRNINNLFSGLMKRFDPASAYKYNSMFYNAKYSHDIKEALANGDTKLAETIMSLLLNEDKAGDVNAAVRKKLIELYSKEYTVLPKSIGDSVSYNGETIKLSKEQRTKFKKVYSQANSHVENMILSKTFNSLSEEKQAKAIKQLYDAYYAKALSETLGVEHDNKLLEASKFVDIASLSVIFAGISEITSDKNSNGATITGSKKAKVIKYLLTQKLTDEQALIILAYHGYTIKDKEYKGLSEKQIKTKLLRYILGLKSATQAEKAKLAELCGFEVRNGRIITQTPYRANK